MNPPLEHGIALSALPSQPRSHSLPRFYFHVSTIDDVFPDQEGVELADLAAAHDCALRIMHRTMLSDPEEQNWRGWMIKIADAKSRTLLTLLYPARKPIRRATFGQRTSFSVRIR
jgi:Domain of unknown function (DUF6894)